MAAHLPQERSGQRYTSFRAFYGFYLDQHANRTWRRLHFVGSVLVLIVVALALAARDARLLWLVPVIGYGFAWVGHFFMNTTGRPPSLIPYTALWVIG